MTAHEMQIIQQKEQRLRATAEKHIKKANAATDETIRRVELHRYDIHVFAAATMHKLITQLEQRS